MKSLKHKSNEEELNYDMIFDNISDEEDESEEFVIPAYTDEAEAEEAIEVFKEQFGENEFICDKKTGSQIVADHSEDDDFIGIAINAPQWDFVVAREEVHDCSE